MRGRETGSTTHLPVSGVLSYDGRKHGLHARERHATQQFGGTNRDQSCGGFPRPYQPTISRGGQIPASLALNRQARPVNARSAPGRASAGLAVRGNGCDRPLLLPSGTSSVGATAAGRSLFPGSPVPGGRGERGERGGGPTVSRIRRFCHQRYLSSCFLCSMHGNMAYGVSTEDETCLQCMCVHIVCTVDIFLKSTAVDYVFLRGGRYLYVTVPRRLWHFCSSNALKQGKGCLGAGICRACMSH